MAAVTGAVIAVGSAAYQIASAETQKAKAKKAINEFQRQDLENPFENIQISREKADQQTEANLSNFATSVDALQRGGNRTVLAGLPKLNEANVLLQNIISADLDKQTKERDFAIAQGEERNKAIRERREQQALIGLGQQLQTARQDSASGIKNLASGFLSFGSALNNQGGTSEEGIGTGGEATASDVTANSTANVSGTNELFSDPTDKTLFPNNPFEFNAPTDQINASLFRNNPLIFDA